MPVNSNLIPGQEDILNQIIANDYPINNLLDIGLGNGFASRKFRDSGVLVTATGFNIDEYDPIDIEGINLISDVDVTNMSVFENDSFDAIWCSHVLEHVQNTADALDEIWRVLKPGGYLFISVPPFKHEVVGGHVTPGWNIGVLAYNLMLSGFNLHQGALVKHKYNIAAIAIKDNIVDRKKLKFSNGDLEVLNSIGYFPVGHSFKQGYPGNKQNINWKWTILPEVVLSIGVITPDDMVEAEHVLPFVRLLSKDLTKRGCKVTIFDNDLSIWSDIDDVSLISKVTLRNIVSCGYTTDLNQASLKRELGVLLAFNFSEESLEYLHWSKSLDIPIVLSDINSLSVIKNLSQEMELVRDLVFRGADHLHFYSHDHVKYLSKSIKEKSTVINSYVSNSIIDSCFEQEKEKSLIYFSSSKDVPGLKELISATALVLSRHKCWQLKIFCRDVDKEFYSRKVDEFELSNRVRVFDLSCDFENHIKSADIFVLSDPKDVIPTFLLNAMQLGLPTIALNGHAGVNKQVIDGATGFVIKYNTIESISSAMETYITDPSLRKSHGDKAKARFEKLHYSQPILDSWVKMFNKVSKKKRSLLSLYDENRDEGLESLLRKMPKY